MLALSKGRILDETLPLLARAGLVASEDPRTSRRLILATLNELKGDKKQTAETLGISLKTLYNRLNIYEAVNRVLPSSDSTGT